VGRWKDVRFTGEKIPALEEVFALVPAGKRIFVEIKSGPESVRELRRCVALAVGQVSDLPIDRAARLQPAQIAFITFDLLTAETAKRALPEHEVCWLADAGAEAPHPTLEAIARVAADAGLDGIDVDAAWPLDAQIAQRVQQMRADAFKLYVWTVDDASLARRLAVAGIDGLTTNRPGWMRAQIAPR
jgi:glycerophosphoryl diester phosphodiesterase